MSQTQASPTDLKQQIWLNHHVDSFKQYKQAFHAFEYPEWVTNVSEALNTGSMESLRFYDSGKYVAVYEVLKSQFATSKSDTI